MNIILIRRTDKQFPFFQFYAGWFNFWAPLAGLVVVVAGAMLWTGYHMAPRPGPNQATLQAYAKAWHSGLDEDQRQIEQARRTVSDNVDTVTRRIGRIQAHVMRLNALGRRLVQQAGLDKKDFNFGRPLGRGGPDTGDLGPAVKTPTLNAALNKLSRALSERESELQVLHDVIMHRHLHRQQRPSGRPVQKGFISSTFGMRMDPFTGKRAFHPGIDFATLRGSAVDAVAAGVVTWAGPRGGYGKLVQINDGDGYSTRYGHNEKVLVHVGERVHKGEEISRVGSTGRSTGPHVHFEVRRDGHPVNPWRFVASSH